MHLHISEITFYFFLPLVAGPQRQHRVYSCGGTDFNPHFPDLRQYENPLYILFPLLRLNTFTKIYTQTMRKVRETGQKLLASPRRGEAYRLPSLISVLY